MKKILALLLCAVMLVPFGSLFVSAAPKTESAFADGENSLLVFVTGIGQSWSYLFDESYLADDAFESGSLQDYENYAPLIAQGDYITRWNMVNDVGANLKDLATVKSALKVFFKLILSVFTRKNTVDDSDADALLEQLFRYNLLDENGQTAPSVVLARFPMPLSEYPGVTNEDGEFVSEPKELFYDTIPCEDICRENLGEDFEDYVYCYNYSPFSYLSRNAEDLHSFIETILAENKVGANKVVLIPMSMGASVVSAYLYKYPDPAQNHVRRVVSIVGCWQGSTVMYDLVTQTYADNSAELFYNDIFGELAGEPTGYLLNILLRLFPKAGLRGFIDTALKSFSQNLILGAPSLIALVPPDVYQEVRPMIVSDRIKKEADLYYDAQITLKDRIQALESQGVTFSFISGYGLPYGGVTSDYSVFGFLQHASRTNSDEIINIDSTAPGTSYVPYNRQFADEAGRELSPDKSIDISTTWNKDSSWFFYKQKHELQYNNTAIRLAISLALGRIKTVGDCSDPNCAYYFPQFNGARDVFALTTEYIPALEAYLANGNTLTPEQQSLYDDVKAMLSSTVNNEEADNALIDRFVQMLTEVGAYEDASNKHSVFYSYVTDALKNVNDLTYKVFGAKGFLDQPLSLPDVLNLSPLKVK